jgi:hypothetical protein
MQSKENSDVILADYFKRYQYAWETQDIAAVLCGIKNLNPCLICVTAKIVMKMWLTCLFTKMTFI